MDRIEDKRGPRMADMTLAVLRKVMNWHATRSDDFRSPIVRGMARVKPKERARSRTLSDDELRAIWQAASEGRGPFPALVKFLLLTAARRNEAASMTWAEVEGTDWTLPASRNKMKVDLVRPLSKRGAGRARGAARDRRLPICFHDGRPVAGFRLLKVQDEIRQGVRCDRMDAA